MAAYPLLVMARDLGLRIPEDISITGYDNLPESELVNPSLTTANGLMFEQGIRAVQMLIEKIRKGINEEEHVRLKGNIIVRHSHAGIT